MKKILSLTTALCLCLSMSAQEVNLIKFLGIPVDGYSRDVVEKLKAKGFTKSYVDNNLYGEFNGEDVIVAPVTNNNKVYRIAVGDQSYRDETQIKIRFNNLCAQFDNNSKYIGSGDQSIPESEDISIQIVVYNKQYQAIYFLRPAEPDGKIDFNEHVWFTISKEGYDKYRIWMYYENGYNMANGEDL